MNNVATMPQQQPAQQQPAPSPVKFTVNCEIDGFAVVVEMEGRADQLRGVIDRLKQIGASPVSKPAAASSPSPAAQSGPPLCPVHGKAMKPSRKPGTFYCTTRNADGSYCQASA